MSATAVASVGWRLLSGGLLGVSLTRGERVSHPALPPDDAPMTNAVPTLAALERIVEGAGCPAGSDVCRSAARRLLGYVQQLRLPARHLWCIVDESGRVLGGALVLPSAGRAAQVLASRPSTELEASATARAITAATLGLRPSEATIAQAVLDHAEAGTSAASRLGAFLAADFTELATLDYLNRPLPRRGEALKPTLPAGVTIDPWRRGDSTLISVLDASYERTLDCPGLCGLRRTEDILAGHLAAGRFVPGLWSILRTGARAVGALLLSPSHSGGEIDLVYLGLAPEVRGRGFGRLLLSHGLHQLAGRREALIALAVDRSNAPAARLYERSGFVKAGSRLAVIKPLVAPFAPSPLSLGGRLESAPEEIGRPPSTALPF